MKKIITIAATAAALSLSTAGAFADGKGGHFQRPGDDINATSSGAFASERTSEQERYPVSMRRENLRSGPTDDNAKVRQSIYDVNEGRRGNVSEYE